MNTTSIRDGDIVQADIRGDRFFGIVTEKVGREIHIRPIGNGRGSYRTLTARQIVGHYRKSKASI